MWDLPGPGLEPVSPALAGGFLTTVPPGKSREYFYTHFPGRKTEAWKNEAILLRSYSCPLLKGWGSNSSPSDFRVQPPNGSLLRTSQVPGTSGSTLQILTLLIFKDTVEVDTVAVLISKMRKWRQLEAKQVAYFCVARRQSWDLNPQLMKLGPSPPLHFSM